MIPTCSVYVPVWAVFRKLIFRKVSMKVMPLVTLPFEFFVVRNKNRANVQTCKVTVALVLFNPELNPICYLLALLAHHFLHVSRMRVKSLTLRLLMAYIYIYMTLVA